MRSFESSRANVERGGAVSRNAASNVSNYLARNSNRGIKAACSDLENNCSRRLAHCGLDIFSLDPVFGALT
jgi:hypothetical protein